MARTAKWVLVFCAGVGVGLALTLVTGPAQARGLGTLAGTVLTAKGKPIAGARVIMQSAVGDNPNATVTNSHGRFFFPRLPRGYYDVRATFKGRASAWRHNLEVRTGRQTDVILRLSVPIRKQR